MQVYLSYSHKDASLAQQIAAGLEAAGLKVWDPAREILPGDNWAAKVAQGLQDSQAMVVLLTPTALQDAKWMRHEVEFALGRKEYKGRLIPVVIGSPDNLLAEQIPWILRRLNIISLPKRGKPEEGIQRIAQALLAAA